MSKKYVFIAGAFILACCLAIATALSRHRLVTIWRAAGHPEAMPQVHPESRRYPRNAAELDQLFASVKNWGRWGPDDQLGAANLITEDKRREASALVRLGKAVSLAHRLLTAGSYPAMSDHSDGTGGFFSQKMNPGFTTDTISVDYHSFIHTHLDALCHFPYKERDYNGYPSTEVNTKEGCKKLGVDVLKDGLLTRGILVDIPRLRQVEYLEPGVAVFVEDIEAWEKSTGIVISPGDAIFIRTGRWARWDKLGPWNLSREEAGLHPSVARWLKERGVAVIGTDAGLDVLPSPVDGVPDMPMHVLAINALGITVIDNSELETVAKVAAELKRWEFMVTISPLVVTGGTGSPVNPIAVF